MWDDWVRWMGGGGDNCDLSDVPDCEAYKHMWATAQHAREYEFTDKLQPHVPRRCPALPWNINCKAAENGINHCLHTVVKLITLNREHTLCLAYLAR